VGGGSYTKEKEIGITLSIAGFVPYDEMSREAELAGKPAADTGSVTQAINSITETLDNKTTANT
jgi:CO dehydrogenase nickel-insertion accessory protein CooC1